MCVIEILIETKKELKIELKFYKLFIHSKR
jgi:hypothetical protein